MTTAALAFTLLLLGADPGFKKCKGEGAKDTQTQDARKAAEGSDFFKLAAKQLGAPRSCAVKWTRGEEGSFSTLTYRFEKGSVELAQLPPETSMTTLTAPGGFPDEAALKAAFQSAEVVKQFKIDFARKPEVSTEKEERTETYSSPDEGDNAMVDFTTNKAGKLIKASFHFAL